LIEGKKLIHPDSFLPSRPNATTSGCSSLCSGFPPPSFSSAAESFSIAFFLLPTSPVLLLPPDRSLACRLLFPALIFVGWKLLRRICLALIFFFPRSVTVTDFSSALVVPAPTLPTADLCCSARCPLRLSRSCGQFLFFSSLLFVDSYLERISSVWLSAAILVGFVTCLCIGFPQ
jgi:hypothetical protein